MELDAVAQTLYRNRLTVWLIINLAKSIPFIQFQLAGSKTVNMTGSEHFNYYMVEHLQ